MALSGCWFPAACPWKETPRRYTDRWNPSPFRPIPIPADRLIDPFICIDPECPSTESVALPEMLDLALINSNQTRRTWEDAREAAAEWGIGQAPLYPQVDFNAYYFDLYLPTFFSGHLGEIFRRANFDLSFPDNYVAYGPSVSLTYLLFDWGTTCRQSESLRQTLLQANWTHNREIQTVVENVLVDYYSYLANCEQVVAARANLKDAMNTLNSTEKKHELGISDISDVLQAKTQVAKQDTKLLNDQQMEADSLSKLIADLGIPANTPLKILGEMTIPELDEETCSLDSYLAQAYLSRTDLFAANAAVQSQIASVSAAERNQYPKLEFMGNWNESYGNFSGNGGEDEYYLLFLLQFPIFSGFEYQNQIRKAKAKLGQAQASMRELEIQIIQQVVQSYQDLTPWANY